MDPHSSTQPVDNSIGTSSQQYAGTAPCNKKCDATFVAFLAVVFFLAGAFFAITFFTLVSAGVSFSGAFLGRAEGARSIGTANAAFGTALVTAAFVQQWSKHLWTELDFAEMSSARGIAAVACLLWGLLLLRGHPLALQETPFVLEIHVSSFTQLPLKAFVLENSGPRFPVLFYPSLQNTTITILNLSF